MGTSFSRVGVWKDPGSRTSHAQGANHTRLDIPISRFRAFVVTNISLH